MIERKSYGPNFGARISKRSRIAVTKCTPPPIILYAMCGGEPPKKRGLLPNLGPCHLEISDRSRPGLAGSVSTLAV